MISRFQAFAFRSNLHRYIEEGWTPESLKLSAAIWDKMHTIYKSPHDGFKGMNLSRSGGISQGELVEWCQNKNIEITKESADGLFRVLDEDGNDNVDNAEFLRKIAKVLEDRRRRPSVYPRKSVGQTKHEKGIREVGPTLIQPTHASRTNHTSLATPVFHTTKPPITTAGCFMPYREVLDMGQRLRWGAARRIKLTHDP